MIIHKNIFQLLLLIIVGFILSEASKAREATDNPKAIGMVVTANPLATEAGLEILRPGGSALDAAIAVEATLSLVEPQSSGLGGGGFMVHYDAKTKAIDYYNGREKAPMGATKTLFLDN